MRPLFALSLLTALLLATACGDGQSDDRTGDIVHRLFMAALTQDPGRMESFVGELPPDLIAKIDLPLYPGADLVVSIREPVPLGDLDVAGDDSEESEPEPVLYFVLLDTADSRDRVFQFYEETLDEDPWQLESSSSSVDVARLWFLNVEDSDISGQVAISHGGAEERTTILISLEDAGALSAGEQPFEPGDSLPVPKEFPPDVPPYDGAIITESAFFRAPQSESSLLIFLTLDSQGDVIGFYREEFEANGWNVEEGSVFGLEERITFSDDAGDLQGEVVADRFSLDRTYIEVTVRIQVNPARETEEDGDETPTSSPTPLDATPVSPTGTP